MPKQKLVVISSKSNFILLILLPISLLIGTVVREIIINLITINFLICCFVKKWFTNCYCDEKINVFFSLIYKFEGRRQRLSEQ